MGGDVAPTNVAGLDDYVGVRHSRLSVNAQAREFIDFLMTSPFFPRCPGRWTAGCTGTRSLPG
jgi:hypothetical protein